MLVYRICKNSYADDLSGLGAKLHGGRWNSKGISMLYTSSSRALAALEVLVHIPAAIPLKDFVLVSIELPENNMEEIRFNGIKNEFEKKGLGASFHSIGDEWVRKNRSLVLKVPSLIIPEEYNYLVNPDHHLFSKIKIKGKKEFSFDSRLLKK
jgi:RES domain-containing protein